MPSFATGGELRSVRLIAELKGLLGLGTAVGTGIGLLQQGQSNSLLDQALRSIPNTSKTDAGRALGNFLMNEASYRGKQLQNEVNYRGKQLRNEVNYMGKQLQKGITPYANSSLFSKDQLSRPDIIPPAPGDPRSERAYQQEVSRTAQLTAQDPELLNYEKARIKAAAQGATPENVKTAEDIGMQIWAKKYGGPGGLASKVKPGQAGYEAIQGVIAPGRGMPGSTSLYQGALPGDDYRDYGEPPTGAAAIPGFNTPAITGVAAQTVVPQLDPAQMKAQDLLESFKQGVFDPDLMEQIASSIYNR